MRWRELNIWAVKTPHQEGEARWMKDKLVVIKALKILLNDTFMHVFTTALHYFTVEHLHVCVRGGNTDSET